MAKKLEINDILNAVDNISKIERKKGKIIEKKMPLRIKMMF